MMDTAKQTPSTLSCFSQGIEGRKGINIRDNLPWIILFKNKICCNPSAVSSPSYPQCTENLNQVFKSTQYSSYIRRLLQSVCSEIHPSVPWLGWVSLYGCTTNYPSAHGQLKCVEKYERPSGLYEQHGFDHLSFVWGRMTDAPAVCVYQFVQASPGQLGDSQPIQATQI